MPDETVAAAIAQTKKKAVTKASAQAKAKATLADKDTAAALGEDELNFVGLGTALARYLVRIDPDNPHIAAYRQLAWFAHMQGGVTVTVRSMNC